MKTTYRKPAVTALALAISVALGLTATSTAFAYESPVHVFSTQDVMGGFDGSTFGTGGATQDLSIICDLGGTPCPADNPPVVDKSGVTLYPVDSEFGYHVVDFLGAQGKAKDGDYMEGLVGDVVDNGVQIGLMVSNAATDTYKVKAPMGTWCAGLGGNTVKCETEHYTVMEHINSCHETVPYLYADPVTGEQAILETPDGTLSFDCGDPNAHLDDNMLILVDGVPGDRLVNSTPCDAENDPVGCQMFPNDKTSTQDNLAVSADYSVQLKDDGKPLYGWGGVHKRPNDVRMYARLQLPAAWKVPGADYVVTKAHLIVNHLITNNPNDQLRPEDLENEAATGRKPSYKIEGTPGGADEVWKSLVPCYEGDGDLIDTEDSPDPTFLGVGTYLKNMPFALDPAAEPGVLREDPPYAFSSDLYKGLTNAYYTTLNRDPFEWSYDSNPDPLVQDFVGSALPDDTLGELVSGPRWRLKPNKFGQDLPGLEVPLVECSPPPFQHDNIKYVVGTPTTTVINLLDWNDEGPSPLATSKGWVDVTANDFVTVVNPGEAQPITSNGLPMTSDFDLAVYIKGDRKPTAVYNAQLVIEYEGEVPPVLGEADLSLDNLAVPYKISSQDPALRIRDLKVKACNGGPDVAAGNITLEGVSLIQPLAPVNYTYPFNALASGDCVEATFSYTAPDIGTQITWTAEVTPVGDLEDPNLNNNTMTDTTLVYPLR